MSLFLYPLFTFLHVLLLVWGVFIWRETRRVSALIIILVTIGLAYDNLILSIGAFLEEGNTLYFLNVPRFIIHQLAMPWLIYASFEYTRLRGYAWANKPGWRWGVIALTLIVLGLGIITRILPMDLQPVLVDGITRYVDEGAVGPPIVTIVSVIFVIAIGFALWRRDRWAFLFFASVLVFIGEAIPSYAVRRVVGSGAEVIFILSLLMTERWLETSHSD